MRDLMAVLKALADENRVRALMSLRAGELCACQIIELLGLAPSTVSKHIAILKQARLVDCHKEGRWMFYRLAKRARRRSRPARSPPWSRNCSPTTRRRATMPDGSNGF